MSIKKKLKKLSHKKYQIIAHKFLLLIKGIPSKHHFLKLI